MENINQTQSKEIHDDHIESLKGKEAISKLTELASDAETCFFCTNIKTGIPLTAMPMSVADIDEQGNIWFFSKKSSEKNAELKENPFTQLLFQKSKNSGFLSVYGITDIVLDQQRTEVLWKPLYDVWFPGGKNDPEISLLKVVPTQAHYWDTKHGEIVSFAKMALSLVTGKTMDDGVEGDLEL